MKVTNQGVRDLLATVGPLTTREIAEMRSLLNAARPTIHVSAWTRDNGYGKTYLRAIYSLGSGTNARKPRPFTNAEKCARRRAKYQIPTTAANSVFTWAATL
jgi:hypothetical protein